MEDTRELFTQRFEEFTKQKEALEDYSNRLSNLRLGLFIGAALLIILAFVYVGKLWGAIGLLIAVPMFLALLMFHDRVIRQAEYYKNMAEINRQCLQRMDGKWLRFTDTGTEYCNDEHPYSNDLDIFGQASLFQWLNTTNTWHGRETLQELLLNPPKDLPDIQKRQSAIRELASKLDLYQALQCEGMNSGDYKNNPEKLFIYAEDQRTYFTRPWLKSLFYILPVMTLLAIIISINLPALPPAVPLSLVVLQLLVNLWNGKRVNKILASVYAYKTKVSVYHRLLELVEKQEFADPYLRELQQVFFNEQEAASRQLNRLDKIVGAVAFQYNPIIYFVINTLFFWDIHCLFALERWKKTAGLSLRQWINNIGIYEALGSLAMIAGLHPEWCFPSFEPAGLMVAADDLGHPLISDLQRVNNNLQIENQIAVITGSNMSGKTTLLRTIGVNLVLAYAGAPVCAQKFTCTIMEIYTSMRVSDDLSSGISTFYAELLRIKMIIDFSKEEADMIFLIDEVFRGTNSLDRVAGARNVLLNLNRPWIIGMISTHDYELCELEKDPSGRIKNYHFVESYTDEQIDFDYLLKNGPCTTSNARYLMKMAGIELMD